MASTAIVLISLFSFAGILQIFWLRSQTSKTWRYPLDCRLKWRGERLFGKNKTIAGFFAMIVFTTFSFALFGGLLQSPLEPYLRTLIPINWPQELLDWCFLGSIAGFGYMLGELPNSFIKRQLKIEPGATVVGRRKIFAIVIDQIDSVIGALIAMAFFVELTTVLIISLLFVATTVHWGFNGLLYRLGVKSKPY